MFTARLLLLSLLGVSLGCSRAPRVPADWAGDYTYDADLGRNVADTGMVVTYSLHLQGTDCTLQAEGYQTDENLLCTVKPTGAALEVRFRSFADGTTKNTYGNEPYHRDQTLFTLTHTPNGRIVTRWAAYQPASSDDGKARQGFYFHQERSSSAH
jgi:hypothetical protein